MNARVYPHPIIAREGWPILAGAFILFLVSWWLDLGIITFLIFVFFLFALQFFRDPAREAPEDPRAVVSPVDGQVCKVEKTENPETGEACVKVSIFMNVFNVHSQKAPVAGRITFIQVAGLVARRIICYATVGQELARGERYGFIRFGSRVDVYLPTDAEITVGIGDKVTGVMSTIARI